MDKQPKVFEMELVIKDCTTVFAEGFQPGGFAKQTVTFQVSSKDLERPMFPLAVMQKAEEFLAENVKVIIKEVPADATPEIES